MDRVDRALRVRMQREGHPPGQSCRTESAVPSIRLSFQPAKSGRPTHEGAGDTGVKMKAVTIDLKNLGVCVSFCSALQHEWKQKYKMQANFARHVRYVVAIFERKPQQRRFESPSRQSVRQLAAFITMVRSIGATTTVDDQRR